MTETPARTTPSRLFHPAAPPSVRAAVLLLLLASLFECIHELLLDRYFGGGSSGLYRGLVRPLVGLLVGAGLAWYLARLVVWAYWLVAILLLPFSAIALFAAVLARMPAELPHAQASLLRAMGTFAGLFAVVAWVLLVGRPSRDAFFSQGRLRP